MTREEFDSEFSQISLSEILKNHSSTKTKQKLLTFSCSVNCDLQDFLHNRAITFEKHHRTRTTVYLDNETKEVVAYYSVAIHTLVTEGLDREVVKLLDGHDDTRSHIPCFLIGQLGKSDTIKKKKIGDYILDDACQDISDCHEKVGGRFILLDAVNHPKVIDFYETNRFSLIEKVSEGKESIRMILPYFDL